MSKLLSLFLLSLIASSAIIIPVPYGLSVGATCRYYGYGDMIASTQNISRLLNQLNAYGYPNAFLAAYNGVGDQVLSSTGAIQPYNQFTNPTNYTFCAYGRLPKTSTPDDIAVDTAKKAYSDAPQAYEMLLTNDYSGYGDDAYDQVPNTRITPPRARTRIVREAPAAANMDYEYEAYNAPPPVSTAYYSPKKQQGATYSEERAYQAYAVPGTNIKELSSSENKKDEVNEKNKK